MVIFCYVLMMGIHCEYETSFGEKTKQKSNEQKKTNKQKNEQTIKQTNK